MFGLKSGSVYVNCVRVFVLGKKYGYLIREENGDSKGGKFR